jgi:hypothetical protein
MLRNKNRKLGVCLLGCLGLAEAASGVMRQAFAQEKALDVARTVRFEAPDQRVVQQKAIPTDIAKGRAIEPPALELIQHRSAAPAASSAAFVNPHVSPGKVHWHATFEKACQAAQKSRRPVLLFQMLGKLDDLFC